MADIEKPIYSNIATDFEEVSQYCTYVDHSLLIKVFYKQNTRLFISAPSQFCKSTNMSMIKQFFEIAKDGKLETDWRKRPQYEMFKNLDIVTKGNEEDLKKHLGAHPIVHVNHQGSIEKLYNEIARAFTEHELVLTENLQNEEDRKIWMRWKNCLEYAEDNQKYIETGLKDLCRFLYEAYGKKRVLVLIDCCMTFIDPREYNHDGMRNANLRSTILDSITVGDVADEMIHGVLLTGVSYISGMWDTENSQLVICRFLDDTPDDVTGFQRKDIVPYYGLYEDRLEEFLRKLQEALKFSDKILERKRDEIKANYGGYYTRIEQKLTYHICWLIECFLDDGFNIMRLRSSLADQYAHLLADIDVITDLIKLYGFSDVDIESNDWKLNLKDLVKMAEDPTPACKNVYLMLLVDVGWLAYVCTYERDDFKRKLTLPNRTLRKLVRGSLCVTLHGLI